MNRYYVYILTNRHHTVVYTGFTDNLERRVYEHKQRLLKGFTKKYNCDKLIYYETFTSAEEASTAKNRSSAIAARGKKTW